MIKRPFNSNQKKVDIDVDQYEYIKIRKVSKMSQNMCNIFQKLNQDVWILNQREFTLQEYEAFMTMVLESEASQLSICNNEKQPQQILKLVPMPQFNYLKVLNINDNKINNIEPLQFINGPFLTILMLNDNQITNLQAFRKMKMDDLQLLSVSWNNIKSHEEIKVLGRFFTNKRKQGPINLQWYLQGPYVPQRWFDYAEFRVVRRDNFEENEQNQYQVTKNMLYYRPDLTYEMQIRLAHIPFLAKSMISSSGLIRPKIIY